MIAKTRWDLREATIGVREVQALTIVLIFGVKVDVIMTGVVRFVLVLISGVGFAVSAPTEGHAGIIPWVYDAIFGPVGSMRAQSAGYPMAVGYAPYSAGYAPYSAAPYYTSYGSAYGPVSTAQYSSGGGSCQSCNQASYAPASECSSCGSGNCSTGTCSNCTVNSAPTTSGYGSTGVLAPVPDPLNRSRDEEIRRLERKIEELDHREKETEKLLRRQHSDYLPEQFNHRTYREEEVPARRKKDTFESDTTDPNAYPDPNFPAPIRRQRGAPTGTPTEEESLKPIIPAKDDDKKNEGTSNSKEAEPQTLRLENRRTAKAIAPRERMQIVTGQSKLSVAKSGKGSVKTSETAPASVLVRK